MAAIFTAHRLFTTSLLLGLLVAPLVGNGAATAGPDAGLRLLQAQLPAGRPARQADCDQLVCAVRAATLAHHQAAAQILGAALAPEEDRNGHRVPANKSCACVVRLFRTAVIAAPDHASALLETAEALCPECGDALTAALARLDDKNVVADPGQKTSPNGPDTGRNGAPGTPGGLGNTGDAGLANGPGTNGDPGDPGDPNNSGFSGLSQRDISGLDFSPVSSGLSATSGDPGSAFGFGVGLGAGFPGAPGFAGSPPGLGSPLPAPTSPAVTSVVNG